MTLQQIKKTNKFSSLTTSGRSRLELHCNLTVAGLSYNDWFFHVNVNFLHINLFSGCLTFKYSMFN